MPFAASFELSSLDGTNGFRISGAAGRDSSGSWVASAGDINGDGIDDLIIGARYADPSAMQSAGASYVVFGSRAGFAANLSLSSLNGVNGFKLTGVAAGDQSGFPVASAGDVNGDGIDDLIIGARYADANGANSGASYVVFGSRAAFASSISLASLDGTNGFRLVGAASLDISGGSVASAGDVNGDGIDDLIIGAEGADPNGSNSGASYVVFGSTAGFSSSLNLSTLNGTNGFRINGVATEDRCGVAASAGDVNGDGIDDLIIGARLADVNGQTSGASYVVFGRASGFGATFELSSLDGSNGFRILGSAWTQQSGRSLASAGDVNGDGLSDVIIGAPYADFSAYDMGASFVVFGSRGGFAASLNPSSLDGTNGFRIRGALADDQSGWSVASAGDVNGDGIDDLIVGARYADPNGSKSGASYVIFGSTSGFIADLDLSTLDGTRGFQIKGVAAGDQSGFSVSGGADINGDGADDLIIGARMADAGSTDNGATYVIFGMIPTGPIRSVGTVGNDSTTGGALADELAGGGGNDVLSGMGGDDILDGGDLSDLLYGGDGADDLIGGGGGDILNGDAGADTLDGGDGADKLFGGTGSDLLTGAAGNDRMAGEGDIDTLNGGAGNDYLDGGTGADVMSGGADNDIYVVDDAGDQTIELAGEGYDIVRTALNGWTLADNIEGLELQGSADIDGNGNAGANNLQGNGGANRLDGGAGVDTINGADGDDFIIGGQGNDLLRGGTGADIFIVAHAFGPVLETDQVYDFSAAEGDILDLSGAYAGTLSLVSAFSKHAGEMTLTFAGGITTVRLDINGDGKVDYQMKINGDVTGESGDWLL